ncbi:hypothetical protein [Hwangdonia lutea]|uniref:Uncharacterized protein n=1 Tax=Hwangdonia lutea TaxID=3075823 RepID=A0AA97ELU5_9FLAO|nr:hypothetical protein [Hwangdonia sp. SCSIO 19198]WOD43811.1 hypothetical protein RNZ46_00760 [Hwangdonia sp. SCSIO 19198]
MKTLTSIFTILFCSITFGQIFQDNVAKEPLGEFPNQWDVINGMASIDQADGNKMISIMHGGIIKPIVNGQTNNYLGDDFTVEFDMFFWKNFIHLRTTY